MCILAFLVLLYVCFVFVEIIRVKDKVFFFEIYGRLDDIVWIEGNVYLVFF